MKALRVLEAEGHITLPAPQCALQITGPRLLERPVAAPVAMPDTVGAVKGLAIALVASRQDRAIWSTLMDREHPREVATFAGAQRRYLISSRHGILAAVGFSAAAWYLKPRDLWMAWTSVQRDQALYRVVNLSRFLIRPGVQCRHLASHVRGRVLRCLPRDFKARYYYAPYVVEMGSDQEGICFKAAGFQYSGLTQGRGVTHRPRPVP